MKEYRKLLNEIQNQDSQTNLDLRQKLLAPGLHEPDDNFLKSLPVHKRYVGPTPWYKWIEKELNSPENSD